MENTITIDFLFHTHFVYRVVQCKQPNPKPLPTRILAQTDQCPNMPPATVLRPRPDDAGVLFAVLRQPSQPAYDLVHFGQLLGGGDDPGLVRLIPAIALVEAADDVGPVAEVIFN